MPDAAKRTIAVGITGGIGSGKTEVCRIFERLGAKVLYADVLARDITNTIETVRVRIKKEFGNESYLPDGTLDRKRMAALVFQNQQLKEKLDAIIHPFVLDRIEKEIVLTKSENVVPVLCVEAALLYEAKAETMFDYVIVVDAPTEQRIERIMKRDSLTRAEVLHRISSQMLAKEKTSRADFIIQNVGSFMLLEQSCEFIFKLLTILSQQGS